MRALRLQHAVSCTPAHNTRYVEKKSRIATKGNVPKDRRRYHQASKHMAYGTGRSSGRKDFKNDWLNPNTRILEAAALPKCL